MSSFVVSLAPKRKPLPKTDAPQPQLSLAGATHHRRNLVNEEEEEIEEDEDEDYEELFSLQTSFPLGLSNNREVFL